MKLSVVMPCFNERATIDQIVARVLEQPFELELIAVDDGSDDGTAEQLEALAKDAPALRVLKQPRNIGKGAAVRRGFAAANGDVVLIQDADLEYDPREYATLLAPILDGRADVVYGSRFSSGERRVLLFWHSVANRSLTLLSNMCTDLNLTDMETGYKVFRREILLQLSLREDRFGFEPEVTAKIARLPGIRIYEVPVSYSGRTYAEGKKIGLCDALRSLYAIVKYALLRRTG